MFFRTDPYRLKYQTDLLAEVTLFASSQVPFDRKATAQLQNLLDIEHTVQHWKARHPEHIPADAALQKVVLTPDFHKSSVLPVGTVLQTRHFFLPQATGNDVGCGMRLHLTELQAEQVLERRAHLIPALRHMFFEAGRNIPMNRLQREALLREGMLGLLETTPTSLQTGIWQDFHLQDLWQDTEHTERLGSLPASSTPGLQDFLGKREPTRDGQVGSLGGGNHFAELQRVAHILDPVRAHLWGIRENQVVVMVHSGSVSVGHTSAGMVEALLREHARQGGLQARGFFPMFHMKHQSNHQSHSQTLQDALHNAANFATVNRMMLALMVCSVLRKCGMETAFPLLYDAPHNMLWQEDENWIHRKGATPARGMQDLMGTPFQSTGEPVLVPGSMGTSSFLMAGLGSMEALCSASHGAGRVLSRGQAMQKPADGFAPWLDRVVTPLDVRRVRSDIARDHLKDLWQEAPEAYKNIQAIMETLQGAGMATPVAEFEPLLTLKG